MSCDKLVFDLAQEIEGTPNIFIKKDWLNILDNQNGSYSSNQSVIDTSQLSNSNKFMSYREAYLSVPLLLTLAATTNAASFAPASTGSSVDYGLGLKNWFGSIVHSLTLDYNGTTVIQQTPFCNMWNAFKLMTSLSWSDIATEGATLGFYPDDPTAWAYQNTASTSGVGICNNTDWRTIAAGEGGGFGVKVTARFNTYSSAYGNIGFLKRQTYINFDPAGVPGTGTYANQATADGLLLPSGVTNLWKSYISNKTTGTGSSTGNGIIQYSVVATIYLRHLHSFFNMVPLLKGAYMKATLNLNNATVEVSATSGKLLSLTSVSVPVGGICPLMIASADAGQGLGAIPAAALSYRANLSVGNRCLDSTIASYSTTTTGTLSQNINLYVPAYTFNPVIEHTYIGDPIKTIQYTDIYQYQVLSVGAGSTFNSLLTNGIAGIKSVLVLPYYSAGSNAGLPAGISPYQSPFDPAGSCCTSPLCLFTNFNVVVSGQNAIYNTERYSFEHFNNQLLGTNAVNGSLTDGLTSGLVDQLGFEMEYCYYYTDVSRMLPVEERVPKSVQIIGTNQANKSVDLICFIEYGTSVSINIVTGARV
jgi:hypothetical protein